MPLSSKPLLTSEQIADLVDRLAQAINAQFAAQELLILVVLKGALHFASDLIRRLDVALEIDFIRVKSYVGSESQGNVEVLLWPTTPLTGKRVLIVEDLIDTGYTTSFILDRVRQGNPESVSIAVLLDKASRRIENVTLDHCGLEIEDHFVVGYGMDYNEKYRELPDVYILEDEGA